jgi:ornithine cyclodeaminase/thiomorpholine-carboxylate dehydrogenase
VDIRFLSDADVQRLLDPVSLLDALAEGFAALSAGHVIAPTRQEVAMGTAGSLLTMPAWQVQSHAVVKMVSLFQANVQVGLPVHETLIALFHAETGTPLAVINGDAITALRTAGAAALSTRLLARRDAQVLAILGAGVQGKAHARMLPLVRDFQDIRIASRDVGHAQALAASVPHARAVVSCAEAVRGADVVCLCSSSDAPIIAADELMAGAHVTSVGYRPPGGELGRDVISRGRLFVETRLACELPPAGCAELVGLDPAGVTELGELLLAIRPGRQSDQELTVYKAMGHAMEDLVAANLIYQRAVQEGRGQTVQL